MNKLLFTVSTVSLLFLTSVQSAHAEGIGGWLKGIFSNEEHIDSDAGTHDKKGDGHEVIEGLADDSELEDDSSEESNSPSDNTEDQTNIEEGSDIKESASIKDNNPDTAN